MFDRKKYGRLYRIKNKIKRIIQWKEWSSKNREELLAHKKIYRFENRQKIRQWEVDYKEERNKYLKNKRKIDLKFNLNDRLKTSIRTSLKGNKDGYHWEDLVGYTLNDLIKHLKKTMPKGYMWQDFLNGKLQIDHIIPKSVFNFDKPEHSDFKKCWALENLRLLPARENLIKHNKLLKPFQPALKI